MTPTSKDNHRFKVQSGGGEAKFFKKFFPFFSFFSLQKISMKYIDHKSQSCEELVAQLVSCLHGIK